MTSVEALAVARRRIVVTVFATASLFSAAQIASFTLAAIIASDLAGGESMAGVPSTLSMVGRAAAAFPIGWIMGRFGRRPGLSIGLLLGVVGAALSAVAIGWSSFIGFALGAGIAGAARGAVDLGRYAAADVYTTDRQARIIGFIVFAGTIGAVAGPLLVEPSTQLAARLGWPPDSGPYVVSAVLCLLALGLNVALLRPDPQLIRQRIQAESPQVGSEHGPVSDRPLREIFSLTRVRLGALAMLVGQLVMVMIMVITPLHMDHAGHSTGAISLVIMAHTLGMFGLSGLTGWLIDRAGATPVVIAGAVILIASSLLSPFVTSVAGLAVALFLLGLGWNYCYVAGSALLSTGLSAAESGRTQGAADMLSATASAAGSLSTGFLFAYGAMTLVGAVGLALSLGLFAVLVLFRNATPTPDPQTQRQ